MSTDVYHPLPDAIDLTSSLGPPGPWWTRHRRADGSLSPNAVLIKTASGLFGNLASHTIAPDGTVTPSVLIRGGPASPEYHAIIRLEGWIP